VDTPEQWRQWLRGFTREPEDRLAMALAAVDAFETLSRHPSEEAAAIRPIVQAATSPHKLVFETGCHILFYLAKTLASCRDAIDRMASAKDSTSRFHAIAYLHRSLPEPLKQSVIQRAISDRSGKVRSKAVERIEEFQLHNYVPQLEEMMRTETDAKVLASLNFLVPLLRDGFHLRPASASDGTGYELSVRGCRYIRSFFIPKDDYSESLLRELVDRLRKEP
jgi:hypothetical protein